MQRSSGSPGYYRHSGRVSPLGLLLMPLLGLSAAVALGTVYGYAIFTLPFVYLDALLSFGFALCLGAAVYQGARIGEVRNTGLAALTALAVGCAGELAGWVSWLHAAGDALVTSPTALWSILGRIAEDGAWSIFGWAPTGAALWSIWGIEALLIVGGSSLAAARMLADRPFCERCGCWAGAGGALPRLAVARDGDALRLELELGRFEALAELGKAELGDARYTTLELKRCPRCPQFGVLTVKDVARVAVDDGRDETQEETLIDKLLLDATGLAALEAL